MSDLFLRRFRRYSALIFPKGGIRSKPMRRQELELGKSFDLTTTDWLALNAVAALAERRMDPKSPACQASVRLGLPATFLYRSASEQSRLLRQVGFNAETALEAA